MHRSSDSMKLIKDIAVLGGTPAFTEKLHVGRPNIGNRERFLERVGDMLDRRWLTNDGPLVKEFEQRIADYVGVRHCVAMCNATVALEIAIRALDLKGEVIIPSYTFVATAHALQWEEITPVFADMDPRTHNIDPAAIERLVTPRTSGIIGVHVWGRPCDTEAIELVASRHRLPVIYDAAHAFACSRRGQMVGGFGACEIFSFHATKFLNSFEGGAVTTNDDDLAAKMRLMRNFGFAGFDTVIYLGMNGKMTEVCAAMGVSSLENIDNIIAINRRNYEAYRDGLRDLPGVAIIDYDPAEHNNYQYVVVEVDPNIAALNRDELVAVLHAENVLARKYFWPGCHRMEPYRSLQPNAGLLLTETERVGSRVIVVPTGETVTSDIVGRICALIRTAFAEAPNVRRALDANRELAAPIANR
jgi:dTDP-4-amino-4,6-dideoxygalactose transaminase